MASMEKQALSSFVYPQAIHPDFKDYFLTCSYTEEVVKLSVLKIK